jgi:hypothetical protein
VHDLREAHETPSSTTSKKLIVCLTHRPPFQRSANGTSCVLVGLMYWPTAVHAVVDVQETPLNVASEPRGDGVVWLVHLLPSQPTASTVLSPPTAVQKLLELHETLLSSGPPWSKVRVWTIHCVPSQCQASDPPTAAQKLADVHETEIGSPRSGTPDGMVWIDQRLPFHRSASGCVAPEPDSNEPTTMQALRDVHETLLRVGKPLAPVGVGAACLDQRMPFHRSTNTREKLPPTAMHHDTDKHDTPSNVPSTRVLGWMRQVTAAAVAALATPRSNKTSEAHATTATTKAARVWWATRSINDSLRHAPYPAYWLCAATRYAPTQGLRKSYQH